MATESRNRNIQAAWDYHNSTKHSWHSIHSSNHYLDWNNQPSPFKICSGLEGRRLPTDLPSSETPALDALASPDGTESSDLDLRRLAGLLYYSAGITKRGIVPGGQIFFRAAACTGALYHIEALPGVRRPGGPGSRGLPLRTPRLLSLRQLRQGDLPPIAGKRIRQRTRPSLMRRPSWLPVRSTGATPGNTRAAPTAILTGTAAPCWPTCWPWGSPTVCRSRW